MKQVGALDHEIADIRNPPVPDCTDASVARPDHWLQGNDVAPDLRQHPQSGIRSGQYALLGRNSSFTVFIIMKTSHQSDQCRMY